MDSFDTSRNRMLQFVSLRRRATDIPQPSLLIAVSRLSNGHDEYGSVYPDLSPAFVRDLDRVSMLRCRVSRTGDIDTSIR